MSSSASSLPLSSRLRAGFALLRQAIAGSEEDFTTGPIGRAVFLLAIPMVLEMAMESVFAVVDVFFVSRLGSEAVATIGITESILTLLYAVAIGLSMATTAMVARRIGEKDPEGAARAAVQAIGLGVLVSIAVAIPGALYARDLLRLMGVAPEVVEIGWKFPAIMLGGSATILLLYLINAIFRGAGDASIAMRTLWIANGINLILDPCLIFGLGPFPQMGLPGAAVATTIGRGLGVVFQLWILFRGKRRIGLRLADLKLMPTVMLSLVRVSAGGIAQFLIATGSWLAMMRIVSLFGSAAVAGYTIAIRIVVFAILPSWGMSNAAATLVGQNLGAGQPERARASVWKAGMYNMAFLIAVTITFLTLAEPLVGLFTSDPEVLAFGVSALRTVSYGYVFYAWGMVMVQAFNGAGDTMTPTLINFFCYWCCQLPFAWFLAHGGGMGVRGVFWAIVGAESLLTVVAIFAFRRGTWQHRQI